MMIFNWTRWVCVAGLVFSSVSWASTPMDAEECVRIALSNSAKIQESEAKVSYWKGRLAEVQSVFYPKFQALTFVAPTFGVTGSGAQEKVQRHWKSVSDWGAYVRLEALLAQPLYTFGRVEAGKKAAQERMAVEQARVRETENLVALEVRRYYYATLASKSILPALKSASVLVLEAQTKAQQMYDDGTGDITQVDLAKLEFGVMELKRYERIAQDLSDLALSALKHTMGWADTAELVLAEEEPSVPKEEEVKTSFASWVAASAEHRPEWAQIAHGIKAASYFETSEKKAPWPVVFVAGMLNVGWSPVREDSPNPYHFDPYNEVIGGIALGMRFDTDIALAKAKGQSAHAWVKEVEALKRFAGTGIPLQVKKAHNEVERYAALYEYTHQSVLATRRWMTFAAAAYTSGTGEARDVLEGLVAYLTAKRTYTENLYNYHVAQAELLFASGVRTPANHASTTKKPLDSTP
jgi:multidrug efflux system outer membrane protein